MCYVHKHINKQIHLRIKRRHPSSIFIGKASYPMTSILYLEENIYLPGKLPEGKRKC